MLKCMLEVGKNKKSSMLVDILGHMHKLAKETHGISDVRMFNDQVDNFTHKSIIGLWTSING